jgi:hypothetical protein
MAKAFQRGTLQREEEPTPKRGDVLDFPDIGVFGTLVGKTPESFWVVSDLQQRMMLVKLHVINHFDGWWSVSAEYVGGADQQSLDEMK